MRAAALAGKGEGPRPQEVSDAFTSETLGVGLATGGLLDQPYRRTRAMLAAKNVFNVFKFYANYQESDVAFSRNYPDAWDVVTFWDKDLRANGL